jgi:hypothetical protein
MGKAIEPWPWPDVHMHLAWRHANGPKHTTVDSILHTTMCDTFIILIVDGLDFAAYNHHPHSHPERSLGCGGRQQHCARGADEQLVLDSRVGHAKHRTGCGQRVQHTRTADM